MRKGNFFAWFSIKYYPVAQRLMKRVRGRGEMQENLWAHMLGPLNMLIQ